MGLFSFRSKSDTPVKDLPVATAPVAETKHDDPFTPSSEDPFTAPAVAPVVSDTPVVDPIVPVPEAQPVAPVVSDTLPDPTPVVVEPEENDTLSEEVEEFQVPELAPVDDMPDMPFNENEPLEEKKSSSLVFADPEEEVSEDDTPVERNVTIQKGGVTEIFVEKKEYQQMLLSVSAMTANLQQADDHLARILDDEGIMTAKLAVWHDILSSVQENLIAIDMRLFNEGDN